MTTCDDHREALGGYVLDGLTEQEASAVRAHLDQCADCRAEADHAAQSAALLELARTPVPRVPDRVRDRVVADAARRRGRRRWAVATAAAATIAAVAGGIVGWTLAGTGAPEVAVPLEVVEPFEASGRATFSPDDGAVRVHLEVEGLEPLEAPGVYEAWLYTHDSRILSIGQIDGTDGTYVGELTATGGLDEFRTFWITAEPDARDPAHEGETVLRSPVPELR
jgi:hypothetical protein